MLDSSGKKEIASQNGMARHRATSQLASGARWQLIYVYSAGHAASTEKLHQL